MALVHTVLGSDIFETIEYAGKAQAGCSGIIPFSLGNLRFLFETFHSFDYHSPTPIMEGNLLGLQSTNCKC